MEKRYQVFISSTFRDLIEERQAVLKAVLELDHMPAGMELFPASDDSAWQLIKDVIDSSDYYVLIIGGRYGSLDDTGIGYTEKEYEYAVASNKPVIPLLHKSPDNLPREKTDTDEASWNKLKAFREKVEKRHTCVYWNSSEELKAKVIVGLTATIKRHPCVGWVRADQVPSEGTLSELLTLRRRISELESQMAADRIAPPKGTEDLKQGEDTIGFLVTLKARNNSSVYYETYTASLEITWNEIFAGVAPTLINEASDVEFRESFRRVLISRAMESLKENKDFMAMEIGSVQFSREQIDVCIVQFRALGLIKENQKPRSLKDTKTYWTLTQYGDHVMVQLIALRRTPLLSATTGSALKTAPFNEGNES